MTTIRDLVSEAEENYATGRYSNSASFFKRAGLQTLEANLLPDALYLIYRALLDYDTIDDQVSMVQLSAILTEQLFEYITATASTLAEQGDDLSSDQIISILKQQITALQFLDKQDEVESVTHSLVNELNDQYKKTNKLGYLEDVLRYNRSEKTLTNYLKACISQANIELEHGAFDTELVALASLLKGLSKLEPNEYDSIDTTVKVTQISSLNDAINASIATARRMAASLDAEDTTQLIERYDVEWMSKHL